MFLEHFLGAGYAEDNRNSSALHGTIQFMTPFHIIPFSPFNNVRLRIIISILEIGKQSHKKLRESWAT